MGFLDSQSNLNNITNESNINNMLTYWEKKREQEENERLQKENTQIIKLTFDEEAEEYDKFSNQDTLQVLPTPKDKR